jgi:hypothetical protein
MKLKILFVLFPVFVFFGCGQTGQKAPEQEQHRSTAHTDSADFVIFTIKEASHSPVRNYKPAKLSSEDLDKIETILLQQVSNYNREEEEKFREYLKENPGRESDKKLFLIRIADYKRQLVAGMNPKGELVVWVNCFCSRHFEDWKNRIIIVEDGGKCFFNLTINLSKENCEGFYVNGSA